VGITVVADVQLVGLVLMLKQLEPDKATRHQFTISTLSGDSYLALDGCISAVDEVRLKV